MATGSEPVLPSLRKLNEFDFRSRLDSLDEDGVIEAHWDRFCPIYINLLSVFAETLGAAKVRSLAAQCVRRSVWSDKAIHFCLGELHALARKGQQSPSFEMRRRIVRLKGWESGCLARVLERGKGLILCTYRFGQYSFIPVELSLLGYGVVTPLQVGKFELMNADLDWIRSDLRNRGFPDASSFEGEPKPENIRLMNVLNAEEKTAPLRIARTLRKGGVVVIYTDGNSGVDGPWGDDSRSIVRFLNLSVSVKNGVSRLSSSFQVPILPVLALADDDFGQVIFGDPIMPPGELSDAGREDFVQETTQSLYEFLEPYATRWPEQWEACSALHRWRFRTVDQAGPSLDSRPVEEQRDDVGRLLAAGVTFRINRRRAIAELATKQGVIWVDTKTLKSYKNPDLGTDILQVLSDENGLDQSWIDRQGANPEWKERIHTLLAYLKNLDLIVASESPAPSARSFVRAGPKPSLIGAAEASPFVTILKGGKENDKENRVRPNGELAGGVLH